jgi:hypothetical protein
MVRYRVATGQVREGGPMMSDRGVSSARTAAMLVISGLVIGVLVNLVSIVHELFGMTILDRFISGAIGEADLVAWDSTRATISLVYLVSFVATAIVWLAWQYRIVGSVSRLGLGEPAKPPLQSVLWWFVPFANFVMPYRVHVDLQRTFAPGAGSIVGLWWGSYLGANFFTQFVSVSTANPTTPAEFTSGLAWWILTDVATIASALLAMRMVLRLQAGQDLAIAPPPPPPPIDLEPAENPGT